MNISYPVVQSVALQQGGQGPVALECRVSAFTFHAPQRMPCCADICLGDLAVALQRRAAGSKRGYQSSFYNDPGRLNLGTESLVLYISRGRRVWGVDSFYLLQCSHLISNIAGIINTGPREVCGVKEMDSPRATDPGSTVWTYSGGIRLFMSGGASLIPPLLRV